MTTSERIQQICDRIARDYRPEKIVVFGSPAYGEPGPFSDLDLLVVMPFEGSPLQQAARIISRINPDMGVDLIVRSPAQVRERLAMPDAFMRRLWSVEELRMKDREVGSGSERYGTAYDQHNTRS